MLKKKLLLILSRFKVLKVLIEQFNIIHQYIVEKKPIHMMAENEITHVEILTYFENDPNYEELTTKVYQIIKLFFKFFSQ